MKKLWLEHFFDSIADKGMSILEKLHKKHSYRDILALCQMLLSSKGEATGIALSRELCLSYKSLDTKGQINFFDILANKLSSNPETIKLAFDKYFKSCSDDDLALLKAAVESPRQNLFRLINMAPGGTATLVAMRADMLKFISQHPKFKAIDADFKHLFRSWFNPGFLKLRIIDWNSPATVIEKLIDNEKVHKMSGWEDMKERLSPDRKCFAFFHPALPYEPLIFVVVALVRGISTKISPLLDKNREVIDPNTADTAILYTINNAQPGLSGLSFGNFLIKQVLFELKVGFPKLKVFSTLSPMPNLARTIQSAIDNKHSEFTYKRLQALLGDYRNVLSKAAGTENVVNALNELLKKDMLKHKTVLSKPLERLSLAYLALLSPNGKHFDRVTNFHLSNGARIEKINPFADISTNRMQQSYGFMVNYLYEPDDIVKNHESFVNNDKIAMSKHLLRHYNKIASVWKTA